MNIIITGTTEFNDYFTPLIGSIRCHEPKVKIIVIDNASPNKYPVGDYDLIRFDEKRSWSQMLNAGAEAVDDGWLMMLNDDVLCTGTFVETVEALKKNIIYTRDIRYKPSNWGTGKKLAYLHGWLMLMQKRVFGDVGGFDENYPASGVDDIDFSWTAQKKGYKLQAVKLPFIHIADQPGFVHRRKVGWQNYEETMAASKRYFLNKVHGG